MWLSRKNVLKCFGRSWIFVEWAARHSMKSLLIHHSPPIRDSRSCTYEFVTINLYHSSLIPDFSHSYIQKLLIKIQNTLRPKFYLRNRKFKIETLVVWTRNRHRAGFPGLENRNPGVLFNPARFSCGSTR